ncbi:MAG TPA: hypothetical protein PK605_01635 [Ignavibacteria bacterium]|nr:hypothetical protein [Bacteroidota bacterium]HRE11812.1 hypothetical protein [Ignavibacteria bacterium]HRF67384.1 hypothetical protein [Ignavibacteria bacterium]HRJ03082.1 hypothetical protein [Ignavibacteria bacterium]HRJ86781.1 hypothetical protein [Ignavibacteria bacterium]
MSNTNINESPGKNEIYDINPSILNSPMGYSAVIEGDNIMVVSHLFGEGFNSRNEKIRLIKEEGFVLINGEKTASGKFENLSDTQLFQLVSAGVILMNEKQIADFRKKFFGKNTKQSEKKNR